jgi:hypothetical protein
MKLVVLVAVLAGCNGDHKAAPAPASGSAAAATAPPVAPPVAAVPDVCAAGVRAFDSATCTTAQGTKALAQAKQTLSGTLDIAHKVSTGDPHQLQIVCAQLVQALLRDAASLGCKVEFGKADLDQIGVLLEAYYAQRTPVVPTGDANADVVIKRIVAVRDAMCACTDMTCVARVDKTIDSIGTFAFGAPQAARDLGTKLLEDVSRCEARLDNTRH